MHQDHLVLLWQLAHQDSSDHPDMPGETSSEEEDSFEKDKEGSTQEMIYMEIMHH